MNKVFKVLWNKSRATHVVTDEHKRANGKGKSQTALLLTASLLAGTLTAGLSEASQITQAEGWNHTSITTTGNVIDIKTDYANGKIGVNHFNQFQVTSGDIANLHLADKTTGLVNFVNKGVDVQGTVNALKDRAAKPSVPGGDLYFVTPEGFTVGANGVINAGSLTSVVTTQDAYESFTKLTGDGKMEAVNEAFLTKLQKGDVPLNPAGVITVSGDINAGNRVVLAASKITVAETATIDNTVSSADFANLVNLNNRGSIANSADATDGNIEFRAAADGSGDIILMTRSQTKGNGSALTAPFSKKAEASVNVAGNVKGRENVKITAVAGAGEYNFDYGTDLSLANQKKFKPATDAYVSDVSAKVTVAGTVEAAGEIVTQAEAHNVIGGGSLVNMAENAAFNIAGAITDFNFQFAYTDAKTFADVTVEENARLEAGKSLTLAAESLTDVTMGADLSSLKLWVSGSQNIPAVGTTVTQVDSDATVTVKKGATLKAVDNLAVTATDTLKADLHANAITYNDPNTPHIALNVALLDSKATVKVEEDVTVDVGLSSADAEKTGVSVKAIHKSNVKTSARANQGKSSEAGVAVNYTQHDTAADVILNSGLGEGRLKTVDILASNITEREKMAAVVQKPTFKLTDKVLYQIGTVATRDFVSGIVEGAGGHFDQNFTQKALRNNIQAALAVGAITGGQTASVTIGDNAGTFAGTGTVSVGAKSQKLDHVYHVESNEVINNQKLGGALSLLVEAPGPKNTNTVSSDLIVGNGNILKAGTALSLENSATIEYNRVEVMNQELMDEVRGLRRDEKLSDKWQHFDEALDEIEADWKAYKAVRGDESKEKDAYAEYTKTVMKHLLTIVGDGIVGVGNVVLDAIEFAKPVNYLHTYTSSNSSYDPPKPEGDQPPPPGSSREPGAASGSVTVLFQNVDSNLDVGKGTILESTAGDVSVTGSSHNASVAMSGNGNNIAGIPIFQMSGTGAIGASVLWQNLKTDNLVRVREGANLTAAKDLDIVARDGIENVTIGASADIGSGKLDIQANAVVSINAATNRLSFDDEARAEGHNVNMRAERKDSLQAIAGGLAVNIASDHGASAVAAGIGVTTGELSNTLKVEDNDTLDLNGNKDEDETSLYDLTGGIVGLSSDGTTGAVNVQAYQDSAVNTIGVSTSVAITGEDEQPTAITRMCTRVKDFMNDMEKKYYNPVEKGVLDFVGKIPVAAKSVGTTIGQKTSQVFGENSSTSSNLNPPSGSSGLDAGNMGADGPASTRGDGAATPGSGAQKGFQLGLAASIAWNDTDYTNAVDIEADSFEIATKNLTVEAVADKFIGSWAGAAGVNVLSDKTNPVDQSAAVGGALAVNSGESSSTVRMVGNKTGSAGDKNVHGIKLTGDVDDVTVLALSDGATIAEGLAAAISYVSGPESGSHYGIDASISVNLLESTVTNDVAGITETREMWQSGVANTESMLWSQNAWSGEYQLTGGTGFGLTTEPAENEKSVTFGAIVAVADIDNTVRSTLADSTFADVRSADVKALASMDQWTTSLAIGGALGDAGVALTGAASAAELTNTVSADMTDVSMTLSGPGGIVLAARDSTEAEDEAYTKFGSQQWDESIITYYKTDNETGKVTLQLDPERQEIDRPQKTIDVAALLGDSTMSQKTLGLSLGYGGGSAAGAGIVVNQLNNSFTTDATRVTINDTNLAAGDGFVPDAFTQVAKAGVFSFGLSSGIAASGQDEGSSHFAAAGSVVVGNAKQTSESTTESLNVTSGRDVKIFATNAATTIGIAGEVGVSTGARGNAAGGAVVVMNTDNDARVKAKNLTFAVRNADLAARNEASAWSAAAGTTIAGGMAFGGSVSVNRMMNNAVVDVKGVDLTNVVRFDADATDESALWSLAGQVAVGTKAKTGFGGAVAYAISGRESAEGTAATVDALTIKSGTTDVEVDARATDEVHSMSIGIGTAGGGVGLAGAAGANEVKRRVNAELTNLSADAGAKLDDVAVRATQKARIDNVGIVAAYGTGAGIGAGIGVNRIFTDVNANLTGLNVDKTLQVDTIDVKAKTENNIINVGVGGSGAGGVGFVGSVAVNLIDSDTTAGIERLRADVAGAAQLVAQSDDDIFAVSGLGSGGGNAAGLSVTVNEREGDTEAKMKDVTLAEKKTSEATLDYAGEVDERHINHDIVGEFGALLKKRTAETTTGIRVAATSTASLRSMVVNGAVGAVSGSTGTVGTTYLGGSTRTTLDNADLTAKEALSVTADNRTNVANSSLSVSGGGVAGTNIAVNVVTTEHLTETSVDGGRLESEDALEVAADAKEGVSSMGLEGSAGAAFGGGAVTNVVRELSDAATRIGQTRKTRLVGDTVDVTADYLGRYNSSSLLANASGAAAGNANVLINYADNDAIVAIGDEGNHDSGAVILAKSDVRLSSLRRTENSGFDLAGAGSAAGSLAANVMVNTIEGGASTDVAHSAIDSVNRDSPAYVEVLSETRDNIDLLSMRGAGALGTMNASVVVNRLLSDAQTRVNASSLSGADVAVRAMQNRDIDMTTASATGGVGVIGANVAVTVVGTNANPLADDKLKDDLAGLDEQLAGYVDAFGRAYDPDKPSDLDIVLGTLPDLAPEDIDKINLTRNQSTVAQKTVSGANVVIDASTVSADRLTILSEDNTGADAGVRADLGSGALGLGVLGASVATLFDHHNLGTTLSSSQITAKSGGTIGTLIGGESKLKTYQNDLALASGKSAYSYVKVDGQSTVTSLNTQLKTTGADALVVDATDKSDVRSEAFGITIGGITAGAMIADLNDSSDLRIDSINDTVDGRIRFNAHRDTVRGVDTLSGWGGAATGIGSRAWVSNSGNVLVTAKNLTATGETFEIQANNAPDIRAHAEQGYLSALNVGVQLADAIASGKAEVNLVEGAGQLAADTVKVTAASGLQTSKTKDDRLKMSVHVESNGGQVVGTAQNRGTATNKTETVLNVKDRVFSDDTEAVFVSTANADYDLDADVGDGGVVAVSNSVARVEHEAKVAATFDAAGRSANLKKLTVTASNIESTDIRAFSAGGGVIDGSYGAAQAEHKDSSATNLAVKGNVEAASIELGSSSTHTIGLLADNTKGTVLGGSSAFADNRMTGSNTLDIAGRLTATDKLRASVRTDIDIGAAGNEEQMVASNVYGVAVGGGVGATNTVKRNAKLTVRDAAELTAGEIDLSAFTKNETALKVRAASGGVVSGVTASVVNDQSETNEVTLGNAVLKSTSVEKDLSVYASSDTTLDIFASGDMQGAAVGGAGASVKNTFTRNNTVTLGSGADLAAKRDIRLNAGRDNNAVDARLNADIIANAFARGGIAVTDPTVEDTLTVANRLDILGDATAVRNIYASADTGEMEVYESSRYWNWATGGGHQVDVSTSGASGKKVSLTETNEINVDGTLVAGTKNSSDIVISGILNLSQTDASVPKFEGGTDRLDIRTEGEAGRIDEFEESLANTYIERYNDLLKLIAEYGDKGDAETRAVVLAYRSEAEYLKSKMLADGLAVVDEASGALIVVSSEVLRYVKVSDLVVSGGNILLDTKDVSGSGTITANAAKHINIDNRSNLGLVVNNVRILDKGGNIELNGVSQTSLEGFDGQVTVGQALEDPTISINSSFAGQIVATDNEGRRVTLTPDNSIRLEGVVANDAGSLSVTSGGDIMMFADRVGAAGRIQMNATGSVFQAHQSGFVNIGGSVEELYGDLASDRYWGVDGNKTWENNEERTSNAGLMIAGGDIFIAADNINLNGMVQSGYADWGVDYSDIPGFDLEERLTAIEAQWKANGASSTVNPLSEEFLIARESNVKLNDGTYARRVNTWYDPVNRRIIVDNIEPKGGRIYLTGRISNTGGGKLYAAAGNATVKIDALDRDVQLGRISTGNTEGLIQITDTMYAGKYFAPSIKADALVTTWTNSAGNLSVDQYWQCGDMKVPGGITSSHVYVPKEDLHYMWSTGLRWGKESKSHAEQDFVGWELFDWGDLVEHRHTTESLLEDKALSKGAALGVLSGSESNFVGTTTISDRKDSGWSYKRRTEFNTCFHFSGTRYEDGTRTESATRVHAFAVKADKPVDVKFLKGANSIDVKSEGSIFMGGTIDANAGHVNLTAGESIVNVSRDAAIRFAEDVTLSARTGSIGSANSALQLSGNNEVVRLTASAADGVYVNADLGRASMLSIADVTGKTLDLTTSGDMAIANAVGDSMNFVAKQGSLEAYVRQTAGAEDAARLDARAAGNVTITAEGDLGLGQIKSDADVFVTVRNGELYDAQPREDLDNRSAEEKIAGWIEAGILGADGENNGAERFAADVKHAEDLIKADYRRYLEYVGYEGTFTGEQEADFAALDERFAGIDRTQPIDSAYAECISRAKADPTSEISTIQAARDNFGWNKNELLYAVSNAIVNPDPDMIVTTGPANIIGHNVTVVSSGNVGHELGKQVFEWSELDFSNGQNLDVLKLLARAEVDDVKWADGESLTIELKRPISIESSGRLDVNAVDSIFIGSEGALDLGRVTAANQIRLTAAQGLTQSALDGLIQARNITLRGGAGSVGAIDRFVNVNTEGGWLTVSGGQSVYINEETGTLSLLSAGAGDTLSLKGDSIEMADNAGQLAEGYLRADRLVLDVADRTGHIGTSDSALKVYGTSTVVLTDRALDSLNVHGIGTGTLSLTGNAVRITGDAKVATDDSLDIGGLGIVADNVMLSARATLDAASADICAQNGLSLSAGNAIEAAAAQFEVGAALRADAETIDFDRSTISATGIALTAANALGLTNASLDAKTGNLALAATAGSIDLSLMPQTQKTLTAKSITMTAGENIVLINRTLTAEEAVTLEAARAQTATNADLNAGGLLTVKAKALGFNNAKASAAGLELTATDSVISIANAEFVSTSAMTMTAAGAIAGANSDLSVQGTLRVAGDSINLDHSMISATGISMTATNDLGLADASLDAKTGAMTLIATAGTFGAANAELDAGGTLTAQAKSLGLNNAKASAAGLELTATDGAIGIANAELVSTRAMTMTASGAVEGDETKLTASNALTVTGDAINMDRSTLSALGIDMTATNDLGLADASLDAKTGAMSLTAEAGGIDLSLTPETEKTLTAKSITMTAGEDITLTNRTLTAEEAVTLEAARALSATNADLNAGSMLTAQAKSLGLNNVKASAAGLELTATDGAIGIANAELVSTGAMTMTASGAIEGEDARLSSEAGLTAEGDSINLDRSTISATGIALTAANALGLADASLDAKTGAMTLTATAGTLDTANAELEASGAMTAQAKSLGLNNAKVSAADLELTATDGAIGIANAELVSTGAMTMTASGAVEGDETKLTASNALTVTGDAINMDRSTLSALGIDMTATNDLGLAEASLDAKTGAMSLTATAGTLGAANAELDAGGTLTAQAKSLGLNNTKASAAGLELTATDGAIGIANAELVSTGAMTMTASGAIEGEDARLSSEAGLTAEGDSINLDRSTISATGIALTAANALGLADASLDAKTGAMSLTAEAGGIDLSLTPETEKTLTAKSITMTAGEDITLTNRTLTAEEAVTLETARALSATNAGLNAGSMLTAQAKSLGLNNAKASAAGLELTATDGAIGIANAELVSTGAMTMTASGAVEGDETKLTASNALTVTGDAIDMDRSTLSALGIDMTATNDLGLAETSLDAKTGAMTLTATAGTLDAANAELEASGAMTAQAKSLGLNNAKASAAGLELTATDGAIGIANAELVSAGAMTMTASGAIEGEDARLSSEAGLTAEGDSINLDRSTISATGIALTAANALGLADASLDAKTGAMSLTAEAGGIDLSLTPETQKTLAAKSIVIETMGDLALTNRTIEAPGTVVLRGYRNVNADRIMVNAETLEIMSSTGRNTMANANVVLTGDKLALGAQEDLILDGTSLTSPNAHIAMISAAGRIGMSGLSDLEAVTIDMKSQEDMVFDPQMTLHARGNLLRLDTDGRLEANQLNAQAQGMIRIEAGGDADLRASALDAGSTLVVNAGLAGGKARLDLTGAHGNAGEAGRFSAQGVSFETTGELVTGDDTLRITAEAGDAVIRASGVTLKPDAYLTARGGNATINVEDTLNVGSGFRMEGLNVAVDVSAGALTLNEGTSILAEESLHLAARDGLTVKGDADRASQLDARRAIELIGGTGDVLIEGAVRVGSRDDTAGRTDSLLIRARNVLQTGETSGRSIVAKTLDVEAQGRVTLGSVGLNGEDGGNEFERVTIDANEAIALGMKNAGNTTLVINEARDGAVNGDLIIHAAQGNGTVSALTLQNSLDVDGKVLVFAGSVRGEGLQASKTLDISTASYDKSAADGIFMRNLDAERIVLLSENGSIEVSELKSHNGLVNVIRRSVALRGLVSIANGESASSAILYNGNGSIGGAFHAADTLRGATGNSDGVIDAAFSSDIERASKSYGVPGLSIHWKDDFINNQTAESLVDASLPHIALKDTDAVQIATETNRQTAVAEQTVEEVKAIVYGEPLGHFRDTAALQQKPEMIIRDRRGEGSDSFYSSEMTGDDIYMRLDKVEMVKDIKAEQDEEERRSLSSL